MRGCLRCIAISFLIAVTGVQAQDADPDVVGDVSELDGLAEADRPDPIQLALQDAVFRTDLLRTAEDSSLTVALDDGSWFSMDADTEAQVSEYLAGQDAVLTLTKGRLKVFVSTVFSRYDSAFRVRTDEAVIGVQGTFFIITRLIAETTVFVLEGIVAVTSTDPRYPRPVTAGPGQFVRVPRDGPPSQPINIDQNFDFGQSSDPYASWRSPGFPVLAVPLPGPAPTGGLVDDAIRRGTTPPPPTTGGQPPPAGRPPPAPAPGGGGPAAPPRAPGKAGEADHDHPEGKPKPGAKADPDKGGDPGQNPDSGKPPDGSG